MAILSTPADPTLVVLSGPGREECLRACLSSVLERPTGPLVDRVVVGWYQTSNGVGPPDWLSSHFGKLAKLRIANDGFLPRRIMDIANTVALEHKWALWLKDDEVVLPGGPEKLVDLLDDAGLGLLVSVTAVGQESARQQPRVVTYPFARPQWVRPSHMGSHVWMGYKAVPDFAVQQLKPLPASPRINLLHPQARPRWFSYWWNLSKVTPRPAADSIVGVYCADYLEHETLFEGRETLVQCHKMLRPGGTLRIATIHLDEVLNRYGKNTLDDYAYGQLPSFLELPTRELKLAAVLDKYRQLYNVAGLCSLLEDLGFEAIMQMEDGQFTDNLFWDIDELPPDKYFFIEAKKR